MRRRKSKNESALIALAATVGLLIWIFSKITDRIGVGTVIAGVAIIVAATALYFVKKRMDRLAYLRAKWRRVYRSENHGQKTMARTDDGAVVGFYRAPTVD
jgi:hypothetical protein